EPPKTGCVPWYVAARNIRDRKIPGNQRKAGSPRATQQGWKEAVWHCRGAAPRPCLFAANFAGWLAYSVPSRRKQNGEGQAMEIRDATMAGANHRPSERLTAIHAGRGECFGYPLVAGRQNGWLPDECGRGQGQEATGLVHV